MGKRSRMQGQIDRRRPAHPIVAAVSEAVESGSAITLEMALRDALETISDDVAAEVARERKQGTTWAEIGRRLHMTRPGATKRFGGTK